jgi:Domain of unknown function (DUF5753)
MVMRERLDRLLEFSKLPNITIQIVPWQSSGSGAEGSFTVRRFAEAELPDVVYVEHLSGALDLDRQDEIELYGRAVDRLTVDALTRDESCLLRRRSSRTDSSCSTRPGKQAIRPG